MADLSQLFQASPGAAAILLGQNNALDQSHKRGQIDELAQIIQGRKLQNEFDTQINPLKVANQGLINQGLEAEIPGKQALSQSHIYDADYKARTNPTRIAAGNAENEGKIGDAKMKALERTGHLFRVVGQNPNAAGPGMAMKLLIDSGMDPSSELAKQIGSMPPEQIPQFLTTQGTKMMEASQAWRLEMEKEKTRLDQHRIDADSRERVMQMQINAGRFEKNKAVKEGAQLWDESITKAQGASKKFAAATAAAQWASSAGDDKLAAKYQAIALSLREQANAENPNGGPKPGGVDIGRAGGVPVNPPRQFGYGGQPGPAPQAPPFANNGDMNPPAARPATDPSNVRALVEAKGEVYDPARYEYRVSPNGEIQKRLRGR